MLEHPAHTYGQYNVPQPEEYIRFKVATLEATPVCSFVPNRTVQFSTKDAVVGTFDFNQVPATFTGDVDASAKLFVEAVLNIFNNWNPKQ